MNKKPKLGPVALALKGALYLGLMSSLAPFTYANDAQTELNNPERNLSFTLITGDKVSARLNTDGTIGGIRLLGENGEEAFTSLFKRGGESYVIPASAQAKVDSGALDRELFNIDKLYQAGYDDASSDSLQVIVEYRANTLAKKPFSMAMPGAKVKATFEVIDSVVMTVEKDQMSDVLSGLSANTAVEGVWLDGMVQAHKNNNDKHKGKHNPKDRNKWWKKLIEVDETSPTVPLTGAYGPYAIGYNGAGVKVAVLDTGYDTDHPDLSSNVFLYQDFNSYGSTGIDDFSGHGTHTASTVAGSGIESDGKYVGMAPGAQLMIGKVLSDTGSGTTSGILAGMQWAVDNGADIVSMSLGGSVTSCDGPMVDMVEALSDEALFVISAGNSFIRETIGSPGCSPSALTVGAIDRAGNTAEFSSRGPSPDGHSAKPDITSQGVSVIAAASGGKGDYAYRANSGTSMSAPHVSGGAALVLQARPDLTPAQLKAVLTSSVAPTRAHVLDQGAGPMDVNQAMIQSVIGAPNLELGFFDSQSESQVHETSVTLTNLSDEDVTFDLDITFVGEDDKPLTAYRLAGIGSKKITVPANGTAEVPVWINPTVALKNAAYGTITGRLVGKEVKDHHGKKRGHYKNGKFDELQKLTVPVSFWIEPPTVNLTLNATDRLGLPAASPSKFYIMSGEDSWGQSGQFTNGSSTIELPKGQYSIVANIMTYDNPTQFGGLVESAAMMAELDVNLDTDTAISFDANQAKPVTFKTDKPSQMQGFSFGFTYALSDAETLKLAAIELAPDYVTDFYALSTGQDERFRSFVTTRAYAPKPVLTTQGGYQLDYILAGAALSFNGTGSAQVVAVGDGGYNTDWNNFDVAGKIALVDADYYVTSTQVAKALEHGAVGVISSVINRNGRYKPNIAGRLDIPVASIAQEEMAKIYAELEANQDLTISWSGTAHEHSPYVYSIAHWTDGAIETGEIRIKNKDLAQVESTHYTQGAARIKYTDTYTSLPSTGEFYSTGSPQMVATPQVRTEYFTATGGEESHNGRRKGNHKNTELPSVTWTNLVMPSINFNTDGGLFNGPREYSIGDKAVTSWDKAPLSATLLSNGSPRGYRDTNLLHVKNSAYGDAAGHDGGLGYSLSSAVGYKLNGEQISLTNGYIEMPDENATVEYSVNTYKRGVGNIHLAKELLGSEIYVSHTFTSNADTQGVQPILMPLIDIPLDLENTAPANTPVRIKINGLVEGIGKVDLTQVKVMYRYGRECRMYRYTSCSVDESQNYPLNTDRILPDDIAEIAQIENINGDWYATIPNDAIAGDFVHLRVIMTDVNNSTTDQAVIRAYMID
ncbi:S8 family serine peptidase [Pseudoalteromonas mariniglutinosa]